MRYSMICVVLLAIPVTGRAQAPGVVDALTRLETAWNDAHKDGDAAALEQLWAEDLEVDVPGMPPMSKTEALAFARTGRMRFERYDTSDLKVRIYGDAAVVTGRLQRTRVLAGRQSADDWRFTKVYARQDGRWRVVSFHASEAPAR